LCLLSFRRLFVRDYIAWFSLFWLLNLFAPHTKGYWCELIEFTTVWPGSESLVEMFKLQMLDCKILVTSRAPFRRFGTPFQLDPLDHDHAVSLFHQYAQLNHSSPYIPDKNLIDEVLSLESN
jgi:hypothetical protein